MADFVAVLKKTIEGLSENSPEMREKVYRKARETVSAKLAAINPPPSGIVIERQKKALEDAIRAVEAGYRAREASDDFDSVLAGLAGKPLPQAVVSPVEAPPAEPTPSRVNGPEEDFAPSDASGPAPVDTWEEQTAAEPQEELTPVEARPRREPRIQRRRAGSAASSGGEPQPRRASTALVAALVAIAVVGAAGYGVWTNRDAFGSLFGGTGADTGQEAAGPSDQAEAESSDEMASTGPAASAEPQSTPAAGEPTTKFTQRLTEDGKEIDEGPVGGPPAVGEGTSLAAATQAPNGAATGGQQAAGAAADQPQGAEAPVKALPVGQRAIFYEERTSLAEGTADVGATVWSLVQESPGNDLPPEPAIRAEVTVPGKNVQLKMTIRRNADKTLPASHIIEMIFLGNFEGGSIDNVLRIALKNSEEAPGSPLIGIPAKIADGYFLVALSDSQAERDTNLELLLRQSWIDIPIVYKSGRRALVTMEKGVPGDKVFQEAIQAWQNASSG